MTYAFFRQEGFSLNEETWVRDIKEKREIYGISQQKLALAAGITRPYLSDIETGKAHPSEALQEAITEALERFNPDNPLEMLFDYVRIRFPTTDVKHIVEDVLRLKLPYFIHEDYGFYSYTEHYYLGDIFVLVSPELEKGVLLELKGRGYVDVGTSVISEFYTPLVPKGHDFLKEIKKLTDSRQGVQAACEAKAAEAD